MKILLACSAGMSTSLLEQSMKKYIKENNLNFTVEARESTMAKNFIKDYDVILLGPQVKFMFEEFLAQAKNKFVATIPHQMYGMAKGDQVIELVQQMIVK